MAVSNSTPMVDTHPQLHNTIDSRLTGLDALLAALDGRVDDLEARAPVPGPQGLRGEQGVQGRQGERGVQGEQGKPGPAGKDGLIQWPAGGKKGQALVKASDAAGDVTWGAGGGGGGSGLPEGGQYGQWLAAGPDGKGFWATSSGAEWPYEMGVGFTATRGEVPGWPISLAEWGIGRYATAVGPSYALHTRTRNVAVCHHPFGKAPVGALVLANPAGVNAGIGGRADALQFVKPGTVPYEVTIPELLQTGVCAQAVHIGNGIGLVQTSGLASPISGTWPSTFHAVAFTPDGRTVSTGMRRFKLSGQGDSASGLFTLTALGRDSSTAWAWSPQATNLGDGTAPNWAHLAYIRAGDEEWTWASFAGPDGPTTDTYGYNSTSTWLLVNGGHMWLYTQSALYYRPEDFTSHWVKVTNYNDRGDVWAVEADPVTGALLCLCATQSVAGSDCDTFVSVRRYAPGSFAISSTTLALPTKWSHGGPGGPLNSGTSMAGGATPWLGGFAPLSDGVFAVAAQSTLGAAGAMRYPVLWLASADAAVLVYDGAEFGTSEIGYNSYGYNNTVHGAHNISNVLAYPGATQAVFVHQYHQTQGTSTPIGKATGLAVIGGLADD